MLNTFGCFVDQVYDNTVQYGSSAPNYKPWFFSKVLPVLLEAQQYPDFEDDEDSHPCGDCAEYPDCKTNPKDCEYSEVYEGGE